MTPTRNTLFFSRNSYLLVAVAWLLTISFIIDNYWSGTSSSASLQKAIQNHISNAQKNFTEFCKDTVLLSGLVTSRYDEKMLERVVQEQFFLYIYRGADGSGREPIFWNSQVIQPDSTTLTGKEESRLVKLSNGWYVIENKSFIKNDELYKIVALIPVKWAYYINNKYLINNFEGVKNIGNEYDVRPDSGTVPIHNNLGRTLFYLKQTSTNIIGHNNIISVWLRILAALLTLIFIHALANAAVAKRGLFKGFLYLLLPVLALRILSYFLPVPLNFRQFELFDPSIYGSNPVLRSLGDLFINSLLFVWMVFFIRFHLQERNFAFRPQTVFGKTVVLGVVSLATIFVTLLCGHIIRSLVSDSQISFDVINFFTLNIYSVVGFFVLCCIATGYFFMLQTLLLLVKTHTREIEQRLYLVMAIVALLILTFRLSNPFFTFDICLLLWLMVYVFLMNSDYLNLLTSKIIASRFIFWIFFFSVSITAIIVSENGRKELANRKNFAENLYNKSDEAVEHMLNIVMTDFKNFFLSDVFDRFKHQDDNKHIKDSLVNGNPSTYLNKYDTKIYTFGSDETPLFNADSTEFNTLNAVIETQARPTVVNDLFYYDVSFDRFNYISRKIVRDVNGNLQGYVFILSKPKKYKSDALYPELFSKGNSNSIESSPLYAFAVYQKNKLSISHNDYPFPTELINMKLSSGQFREFRKGSYDELWYRANDDKMVVIVKQESFFIESITLFAYLFFVFLAVTASFRLLNILIESRFGVKKLRAYWHISIRNQVHGTIILISLMSFVIIGIATILFFIARYHNNNREKLSRTIHVMENEVRKFYNRPDSGKVQLAHNLSTAKLEEEINKIAEIHSADLNIYDLNGNLRASSLPLPYAKGIVSSRMDPLAYYHLHQLKDVQFFETQKIGQLAYLSNYVPIRDENGTEYAYLNIPYFESQSNLEDEISNFLVTIINLNAFIFLIAGIIALFITNRITRSFSIISNKMKEVNLGQVNEEITWDKQDEIGELVNEYNKMVKKLDTSAEMLARSEREGAWREMARQVAHEIKNPLTPMKLNLQYLQMAIDNNSPNVKNISIYVAKILVEQIDHLSQIAGDFAQFANIGESKNQVFNLNDSLAHVTSLYSSGENLEIVLIPHEEQIMIQADKTQINRLFTNLLQNAVQSVPEKRKARIEITTLRQQGKIITTVTDNGVGIPESMTGKIFTPNFTTKTSGTGLGLAMCKGIVEKSGGRIWFETVEGVKTTFFVELPEWGK